MKKLILKKEIQISKSDVGSKEVRDLIEKMLIKEPENRLTLIDVL